MNTVFSSRSRPHDFWGQAQLLSVFCSFFFPIDKVFIMYYAVYEAATARPMQSWAEGYILM